MNRPPEVSKAMEAECCASFVNGCPQYQIMAKPCPRAVLRDYAARLEQERDALLDERCGSDCIRIRADIARKDEALRKLLQFVEQDYWRKEIEAALSPLPAASQAPEAKTGREERA